MASDVCRRTIGDTGRRRRTSGAGVWVFVDVLLKNRLSLDFLVAFGFCMSY